MTAVTTATEVTVTTMAVVSEFVFVVLVMESFENACLFSKTSSIAGLSFKSMVGLVGKDKFAVTVVVLGSSSLVGLVDKDRFAVM